MTPNRIVKPSNGRLHPCNQPLPPALLWSPTGARLNSRGSSIDLGVISLAEAQKRAWLFGAVLRISR